MKKPILLLFFFPALVFEEPEYKTLNIQLSETVRNSITIKYKEAEVYYSEAINVEAIQGSLFYTLRAKVGVAWKSLKVSRFYISN